MSNIIQLHNTKITVNILIKSDHIGRNLLGNIPYKYTLEIVPTLININCKNKKSLISIIDRFLAFRVECCLHAKLFLLHEI